jgi:hypothetical protein
MRVAVQQSIEAIVYRSADSSDEPQAAGRQRRRDSAQEPVEHGNPLSH